MSEEPKRRGWRRPGVSLVFLAIGTVATVLVGTMSWFAARSTTAVVAAVPRLRARPVRALSDAVDGPGVFHGTVHGSTSTSPLGRRAIAWTAWVDVTVTTGSGKNQRTETRTVCTPAAIGWTELRDGASRVELAPTNVVWTVGHGRQPVPSRGHFLALIDVHQAGGPVPPSVWSLPGCTRPTSGSLSYHERGVVEGSRVVVSGCRRGGVVERCGDELDLLVGACTSADGAQVSCSSAEAGVDSMGREWIRGARGMATLPIAALGMLLGVFAAFQLQRHGRDRSRRHADVVA